MDRHRGCRCNGAGRRPRAQCPRAARAAPDRINTIFFAFRNLLGPLLWPLAAAGMLAAPAWAQDQTWRWPAAPRIVAVGDVHGAYAELAGILEATGVVDASLHWRGGPTVLVSLGDLVDRGADSRKVLDLLMRLEGEARAAGGAVHVVLGNHEVMNLTGDLRYVTAEQYAEFAADEPAALRDAAYARFRANLPDGRDDEAARRAFRARYPPGYFARARAFRPDGRYGRWLLSLPALVVVGDTAFVHAGISAAMAGLSGEQINGRIHDDLRRYLSLRQRLVDLGVLPELDMERDMPRARAALDDAALPAGAKSAIEAFLRLAEAPELGPEGPLWYRGAFYCKPILATAELAHAAARLGVSRVVVGHTPTEDRRVHLMYGDRLVALDTGMLRRYFSGHPAALIIERGELSVRYLDEAAAAVPERDRPEAYGLDAAGLLTALREGAVRLDKAGTGALGKAAAGTPAPAVVSYAGRRLQAVFYFAGRDEGWERELAAERLDSLLGFDLVPPSVEREVEGRAGTLQLRYPGEITESQRIERRLPNGEWCPIPPQIQLMQAFDLLIGHRPRTADEVSYRSNVSDLLLLDNAAAFGTNRRLAPMPPSANAGNLPSEISASLSSLTRAKLDAALGPLLGPRQLAALLARRDALLDRLAAAGRRANRE